MPDPTTVPFEDHGGEGPLLHFAHANGFPPGTYRRLFARFAEHYQVKAIRQRPLWPGEPWEAYANRRVLAEDLIRMLDGIGARGVIGVGHSLGADVTIDAAAARPELFRALVLIEPVLLPHHVVGAFYAGEGPPPAAFDLIAGALKRRDRWPDHQAAFDHFRPKPAFARMDDAALWDYVNAVVGPMPVDSTESPRAGPQLGLLYPREWEARIYARPSTDVWDELPTLVHPTLGLRGGATDTVTPEAWRDWRELQPAARLVELPGLGHLLPMEAPEQVADTILAFLAGLPAETRLTEAGGTA